MGLLPGGMGKAGEVPVVGSEGMLVPLPPRDIVDRIPQAFSHIVECTVLAWVRASSGRRDS